MKLFFDRIILAVAALGLSACQQIYNSETENTQFKLKSAPKSPEININLDSPDIVVPDPKNKPARRSTTEPLVSRVNPKAHTSKLPAELRLQHICRNQVPVTYRLRNQSGVMETFQAKVQAQGTLLDISDDFKKVKIVTIGWFSLDPTLRQWQPYLKQPPLAEGISLTVGNEFWDDIHHWYLCGVSAA